MRARSSAQLSCLFELHAAFKGQTCPLNLLDQAFHWKSNPVLGAADFTSVCLSRRMAVALTDAKTRMPIIFKSLPVVPEFLHFSHRSEYMPDFNPASSLIHSRAWICKIILVLMINACIDKEFCASSVVRLSTTNPKTKRRTSPYQEQQCCAYGCLLFWGY